MKIISSLVLSGILLFGTGAASAADPAPPVAEPAAPAMKTTAATGVKVADNSKVICRTQSVVGSLTQHVRSCHTAQEWRDLTEQTREKIERSQRMGANY